MSASPPSGKTRVFLCAFKVSTCHKATVTRRCTSGQPDVHVCETCRQSTGIIEETP
jgi:hypothetical protein